MLVACHQMATLDLNSSQFVLPVTKKLFFFLLNVLNLPFFFSGDSQHQVHMEGYQVSNQCQALVRDECLVPTKDAPELAYARQSTAEKYIPDVYYKVSEFIYC